MTHTTKPWKRWEGGRGRVPRRRSQPDGTAASQPQVRRAEGPLAGAAPRPTQLRGGACLPGVRSGPSKSYMSFPSPQALGHY